MPFLFTYNVPNPPPTAPTQSQPVGSGNGVATTTNNGNVPAPRLHPLQHNSPSSPSTSASANTGTNMNLINGIIPEMAILVNARFAINRQTFTSFRNIISFVSMALVWLGALFGFKAGTSRWSDLGIPGVPQIGTTGGKVPGLDGVLRLLERMKRNSPVPASLSNLLAPNNTTNSPLSETSCLYHQVTTATPNADAIEQIMLGLTTLYDLENKRLRGMLEALSHEHNQSLRQLEQLQEQLRNTQKQFNDLRLKEFIQNNQYEVDKTSWAKEREELRAQVQNEKQMREEQQRLDAIVLLTLLAGGLVLYLLRLWGRKYREQLKKRN